MEAIERALFGISYQTAKEAGAPSCQQLLELQCERLEWIVAVQDALISKLRGRIELKELMVAGMQAQGSTVPAGLDSLEELLRAAQRVLEPLLSQQLERQAFACESRGRRMGEGGACTGCLATGQFKQAEERKQA